MDEQTAFVLAIQLIALSCIAGALLLYLLCKMSRRKHTYDTNFTTLNVGTARSILITSCETALGLQLALHFSSLGFRVFAGFKPSGGENKSECKSEESKSDAYKILRAKLKSCQNHLLSASVNLDDSNVLKVITLPLDVTREDSLHEAVDIIRRHLPAGEDGLWALINTAGACLKGKLENQDSSSQWDALLKTNVIGTLKTARTFLPLLQAKRGRFISLGISSDLEMESVAYNASRYAVLGASISLHQESRNAKAQFICINPETIPSEKLFAIPKLNKRGARTSEEDCSSNQAAKYNISVLNAFALDIFEEAILTERPKHVYVISKPNDFSHYLSAIVERFQRSQMDKPKVIEA
ncbi:hypothetical protein M8J76_000075 [Diaphorina citri]|nr:hypothetical protein M8J75_015060 [Diaphorina citri]KAI5726292.1 hypothetical protein M8J76_000075 [Diaphorina citri]KAI5731853.1 hypothetical protein M8J77_017303 [Diaphorina citri]